MRRLLPSRSAGFTLIEVLIATGIFAIGSLAILAMATTSIDLNKNSREAYEATQLASWKMDYFETVPPATNDFTACNAPSNLCYEKPDMTKSVNTPWTFNRLPLVSPFCHSRCLERLKKVAKPLASVACKDSVFI